MARRPATCVEDRVVVRHSDIEPALRRELIIESSQCLVDARRKFLVDVEEGVRARIRIRLWLALVFVRAEKVNPIPLDRAAEGHARLLVRVPVSYTHLRAHETPE